MTHQRKDSPTQKIMSNLYQMIEPFDAQTYGHLGNAYYTQNQWEAAIACYSQVLQIWPDCAAAYGNLGHIFYAQNQLSKALACYQQVIRIWPKQAEAYCDIGKTLHAQGEFAEALKYYQQALQMQPEAVRIYRELGDLYYTQNQLDTALPYYQQALQRDPDYLPTYHRISKILYAQNHLEAALELCQTALHIQPNDKDAHFQRGILLLKQGHLLEGWAEYEWRLGREAIHYHSQQPLWDGSPLAGQRLMVHWEQGFGDTLQFIRYLPLIKGGTVIFDCQPPLLSLCQGLPVTVTDKIEETAFDQFIFLSSLPHRFATTLDNLPSQVPYLYPDSQKIASWRQFFKDDDTLHLGIVWAGNPTHEHDSCPPTYFTRLLSLPEVTCYSLQVGSTNPPPAGIISLTDELHDFSDTAAIVTGLDLVICVDTAVAHLAGALGKPVWVLLSFACDWRWLADRQDSPWYPTMRLFRQPQPGDWESVFTQVTQAVYQQRELLQALRRFPPAQNPQELAEIYRQTGHCFHHHRPEIAITCYQTALRIQPQAELYHQLAGLQMAHNQWELALAACQQAIRLQPDYPEAHNNLGNLLIRANQPAAALQCYQTALHFKPDFVEAYNNLGLLLESQNQLAAALQCYQTALQLRPQEANLHLNYATLLLKMGRFLEGWAEYEWRLHTLAIQYQFSQPPWDGTPLTGRRLLIYAEQGFGDTLQFIRYLPLLTGGTVIFAVKSPLATLLQGQPGIDELLIVDSGQVLNVTFDVWSFLLSLPHLLALESIPATIPYLFPDPHKVAAWQNFFQPTNFNVGIVWAGRPTHSNDHHRSCTPTHFAPLTQLAQLFSLQTGAAAAQVLPTEIISLTDELLDFSDTAAVITHLDLIITVDTAIAHLAGALGKPVWLLLPFAADWRWLQDRSDSPWYPTMRLFRQPQPEAWASVFTEVAQALSEAKAWLPRLRDDRFPATSQELAQRYLKAAHQLRHAHPRWAIESYQTALRIHPQAEIYNDLAGLLFEQQQFSAALECCQQARRLNSQLHSVTKNMGLIYQAQNQLTAALECYQQALQQDPQQADVYLALGSVFELQNQPTDALACYQQATHLQPNYAEAYYNQGLILQQLQQWEAALAAYQQALRIKPDYIEAYYGISDIFFNQNQLKKALAYGQQALQLQPQNANTYIKLSKLWFANNQLEEAVTCCQQALQLDPQQPMAHFNLALLLLKQGRFLEAWPAYEWRLRTGKIDFSHLTQPRWEGQPLAGRQLLIHWEQGYGDSFQFIRYLSLLEGGSLILLCQPTLINLFQELPKVTLTTQLLEHDVWIPLLSLPRIFNTTLETIPTSVPYLSPNVSKATKWRAYFTQTQLNIGIVWSGNQLTDKNRSCPLAEFTALADLSHLALFSLQVGEAASQPFPFPCTSLTEEIADFSDTAAIIAGLDLVIAIDTAVAHLAGALGKPVWVLLPYAADWRWLGEERQDSPWYPTMRLFRQPRWGDWSSVLAQVKHELCQQAELLQWLRWPTVRVTPPQLSQTYITAANHLRHQNRPDLAIECYQRAVKIFPTAELYNDLAGCFYGQNRLEEAFACGHQALRRNPQFAQAYHNLGLVLLANQQLAEARQCYQQALNLQPDYVEAHLNLGRVLVAQNQLAAAFTCYQQALQLAPHCAPGYVYLGELWLSQNRWEEAYQAGQQALRWQPENLPAYRLLSQVLATQQQFPAAYATLQQLIGLLEKQGKLAEVLNYYPPALRLATPSAEIFNRIGKVLQQQKQWEAAFQYFREALQIRPEWAELYCQIGIVLQEQNQLAEAFPYYQKTVQMDPQNALAYSNLAVILHAQNQPAEALEYCHRALQINPNYIDAYINEGLIFYTLNQFDAAIECCQRALAIDSQNSQAHVNYGLFLLKRGDFAQGWREFQWRLEQFDFSHLSKPRWDGSPLAGRTLLVHSEQGLGDTLQFVRYLPLLQGGQVILACSPSLKTLLQANQLTVSSFAEIPQLTFDIWTPLLSLPHFFHTTLENLPAAVPYLVPDATKVNLWQAYFKTEVLKVGIVWAGNPRYPNDFNRSCSLAHFAPLMQLPKVVWFSLQKGAAAHVPDDCPVISLTERLTDLSDTAAIIASLDLVISVDTAVAHLAGALGKPVWLLLPFVSDWRWLMDRHDSPWYPTLRLFRQPQPGDWESLFQEVREALTAVLKEMQGC